eukprot:gene2358-2718_t
MADPVKAFRVIRPWRSVGTKYEASTQVDGHGRGERKAPPNELRELKNDIQEIKEALSAVTDFRAAGFSQPRQGGRNNFRGGYNNPSGSGYSSQNNGRDNRGQPVCFHCGKTGHTARSCLSNYRRAPPGQYNPNRNNQRSYYNIRTITTDHHLSQGNLQVNEPLSDFVPLLNDYSLNQTNSLLARVHLNDFPALCLIDTGADISVISAKFWKSIPAEHRPSLREGTWASINTVSGENIQSLGSVTFLLRLLEKHYILDALVVDVSGYDAIMGLDFLIENHAVLDLGLRQLTIQEKEYDCTPPSIDPLAEMPYFGEELESTITVTSATAVETITLAPLSETDVFLRLPESVPLNSEGILEPLSSLLQTCKISGLNTLVTVPDDRIVSFRAINLTDRPTNIYPSQRLASFHTARVIEKNSHRERIVSNLTRAHDIARQNIVKSQASMKKYYDQRATDPDFTVGDKVWVYTPKVPKGLTKKLKHLWHGPYRISQQLSAVHFKLSTFDNRRVTTKVHANHLKLFYDRATRPIGVITNDVLDEYLSPEDMPTDSFDDSTNGHVPEEPTKHVIPEETPIINDYMYTVERILDSRKRGDFVLFGLLLLMLAVVPLYSMEPNIGPLYDCSRVTPDGLYHLNHRTSCLHTMHNSVQPLKHMFATVSEPVVHRTKITIKLCSAYKAAFFCKESFFGSKTHHRNIATLEVTEAQCRRAIQTGKSPYGPLNKVSSNIWQTRPTDHYVCHWMKSTTETYPHFLVHEYSGLLQADDPFIHQSVTSTTCNYRDMSCVPREKPATVIIWEPVHHNPSRFQPLGNYTIQILDDFVLIPKLAIGGAIQQTSSNDLLLQLDNGFLCELSHQANHSCSQFFDRATTFLKTAKPSIYTDLLEAHITAALEAQRATMISSWDQLCKQQTEFDHFRRWAVATFPDSASRLLASEYEIATNNYGTFQEIGQFADNNGGDFFTGLGQVLGRTISALGTGGSKLLDAAGRSVNTALHGIGDAGVKVATGMTQSAGSLIEKGGHAIRDVEHGKGAFAEAEKGIFNDENVAFKKLHMPASSFEISAISYTE